MNTNQSPEHIEDRVKVIKRLYNAARRHPKRTEAERLWKEAEDLYDGKHWGTQKVASYRAQITVNRVYAAILKALSIVVGQRPDIEIMSVQGNDELAGAIDQFIQYLWRLQSWTSLMAGITKDSMIHRVSFVKVYFDKHAARGKGLPKLEPVSPWDLYFDPDYTRIRDAELKGTHFIHKMRMTREAIFSKYQVDIQSSSQQKESAAAEEIRPAQGYDVLEAWIQDDSRVETPETDNTNQPVLPLRYPNGRLIVVAENQVLMDEPNPFSFFPAFVPVYEEIDNNRIYGPSIVNQLASPQYELNKRRSQISDHTGLVSNPIRLIDPRAMISQDEAEITNQPNQSYMDLTGGRGIQWLAPPQLSPEVIQSVRLCTEDIDVISGIHEVTRGETPGSVRSGVAIENLQNEGRGLMNLRGMFFADSLRTIIRNVVSLIVRFIRDNRTIIVEGGQADRVMVNIPELLGNLDPDEYEFEIQILAGNRTLTQRARSELALFLHKEPSSSGMGTVIDDEDLLNALEFPGWRKIIARRQRMLPQTDDPVQQTLAILQQKAPGLSSQHLQDLETVLRGTHAVESSQGQKPV